MEQLIKQLYEAFAGYPKPAEFPACQCCLAEHDKTLLLGRPLAVLTADELSNYASAAFLTVGDIAAFKYFLPRILELSVRDQFTWPDAEVVLAKLAKAGWESWPVGERAIILDLVQAKFDALLNSTDTGGSEIDGWVCAMGQCVPNIATYLSPLLEQAREDKLMTFVEWNMSAFTKRKLQNAFWHNAPEAEQQVLAWLNQEGIKEILYDRYGMTF